MVMWSGDQAAGRAAARPETTASEAVLAVDGSLISCQDCGLLHRVPEVPAGARARCTRCQATLFQVRAHAVDRSLMLNLAALIFFVLANAFPFLGFKLQGREQVSTLITGVIEFAKQDLWFLAIVVFAMTILIPGAKILSTLYVLLSPGE